MASDSLIQVSLLGRVIRILNALAVGALAAFSLQKLFVIIGFSPALLAGAPVLASLVVSGILIAVITYTMYNKDAWQHMKKIWQAWCNKKASHSGDTPWIHIVFMTVLCLSIGFSIGFAAWPLLGVCGLALMIWSVLLLWQKPQKQQMSLASAPSHWASVYGQLGGVIKLFVAGVGVVLLAGTGVWAYAIVPALMVGLAQFWVESAELVPQSQLLFSSQPLQKACPTHSASLRVVAALKWLMVIGHAIGQGLGPFACVFVFGVSFSPLGVSVLLGVGLLMMLVVAPSTGRFYGERFFLWGAEIALDEAQQYAIQLVTQPLCQRGIPQAEIDKAFTSLELSGQTDLTKDQAQALLRYFGYYMTTTQTQVKQTLLGGVGGLIGLLGAGFKGALAFAGTASFCLLLQSVVLTGVATVSLASPPGWVLAVALVIGVATWLVQCSRAVPNTAECFAGREAMPHVSFKGGSQSAAVAGPMSGADISSKSDSVLTMDSKGM